MGCAGQGQETSVASQMTHITLSTCNLLKTMPVCCYFLSCRP